MTDEARMTAPSEVPVVPLDPEGDYASPREVEPIKVGVRLVHSHPFLKKFGG